jgi:hypothetical protein
LRFADRVLGVQNNIEAGVMVIDGCIEPAFGLMNVDRIGHQLPMQAHRPTTRGGVDEGLAGLLRLVATVHNLLPRRIEGYAIAE